jgi:hypothetical protein
MVPSLVLQAADVAVAAAAAVVAVAVARMVFPALLPELFPKALFIVFPAALPKLLPKVLPMVFLAVLPGAGIVTRLPVLFGFVEVSLVPGVILLLGLLLVSISSGPAADAVQCASSGFWGGKRSSMSELDETPITLFVSLAIDMESGCSLMSTGVRVALLTSART